MSKQAPLRMCVICRQMREKNVLLRIVKTKDGEFLLDNTGKMQGRGAYICNSEECIARCIKTKALNRAYKMQINDEYYNSLREQYARFSKD